MELTVERLSTPSSEERAQIVELEAESFSNPWTAETFERMLGVPVSQVYVARRGDHRIVAFCACWVIGDELHINTIAVERDMRRQGIATRLLVEVLHRTNASRATLEVRQSNEAALALYQGLGFKVTAVRHRYYQNPEEDGLILWLDP